MVTRPSANGEGDESRPTAFALSSAAAKALSLSLPASLAPPPNATGGAALVRVVLPTDPEPGVVPVAVVGAVVAGPEPRT